LSITLNGKRFFSAEGLLEDFLVDAYKNAGIDYPKFYKMDMLSKAGFLAAELLFREHPLNKVYSAGEIAVVLSNKHSSLDTDKKYLETAKGMGSPALFVYTLPNIVTGEICIRQKIKGENAFFLSENFDVALISDYTQMLMAGKTTKMCLAGWVDVMDEHHDVFLYLTEKNRSTGAEPASDEAEEVGALYKKQYGTTDR
jgi:hypothetical protein